ncbi:S1 family peptidase [Metallibacterium scheffleri]
MSTPMIPIQSNILHRVFFIKAEKFGTAFTIDADGLSYLVTAKHLFDETKATHDLHVFREGRWESLTYTAIAFCRSKVDIAVLRLKRSLCPPNLPVDLTTAGLVLGQDVYMLGFPHLMYEESGAVLLDGYPLPLVKRGAACNLGVGDPHVLYVDAMSSEGLSGGPVVFLPLVLPLGATQGVRIAGVISGFRTEREPVIGVDGERTGAYVEINTGLLQAYGIQHAIDLIGSIPR